MAAGLQNVGRQHRECRAVAFLMPASWQHPSPPLHRARWLTEPGPSCQCLQHGGRGERGESSGGDFSATAPQTPGRAGPRAVSQVDCLPRGPAPSSDQEPVGHPQSLEREQQPPPGAPDCPRCLELQREVDDLKEQLAAMQSLVGKLEGL
ncbi:uncharacterized protein CXorf49 homolog [Rousettus aegyptiacus]|uniref:uncharacterized protein CXorf49 homolog n=1 Tax=Rousettus aegyptiacus TaxID=9407 RepID=UPI00168CC447|nr:uncharacterized protein CXorf49 homolog [Rousettus aegyptiacus]